MTLTRSSVLHYWTAHHGSAPIIGGKPVHTRSSAGRVADQRGILYAPVINTPRFGWNTIAGERRPTMLLEMARTNEFTYSQEFDNAVWIKVRSSITPNAGLAPDGTLTADKLVENTDVNTTHVLQRLTPALTDNVRSSVGFAVKPAGRNWVMLRIKNKSGTDPYTFFDISAGTKGQDTTALSRIEPLADGWYLCWISVDAGSGAGVPEVQLFLALGNGVNSYTGDGTSGVLVWGGTFEKDQKFLTSYTPAVASTVTRATDIFYWDFAPAPQELCIYCRFIERGTIQGTNDTRVLQIGSAANLDPRVIIYFSAGVYNALWSNATTYRTWVLPVAPVIGDTVELMFRIDSDGTGVLVQSINGAAVSSSVNTSPLAFPSAWSGERLYLNSVGAINVGATEFAELKIVKRADIVGSTVQTQMDELRAFELTPSGEVIV